LIYRGSPYYFSSFGDLLYTIKTGAPAREEAPGVNSLEQPRRNPVDARLFDDAMTDISMLWAPNIAAAYDFGRWGSLMDVGGGNGLLLATIMRANPALCGVLGDQPEVLERARQRGFWSPDLTGRVRFEPIDFFRAVPSGCRAYLMKNVIHDWDDERARRILLNIRRAVPNDGVLLLVEYCLGDENTPAIGKAIDVAMLAMTGGRERTVREHRELLSSAGFSLNGTLPLSNDVMILEAKPTASDGCRVRLSDGSARIQPTFSRRRSNSERKEGLTMNGVWKRMSKPMALFGGMPCFLVTLFFLALNFALRAQSTAQIQGSIQDASGSAVPGAVVKATQAETGAFRTITSDRDGTYVLTNLATGPYRLEVSKPGFSTYVQTGIVLQVESRPTVDISLTVGTVSEQVQVESDASLVETQSTNMGSVIENRRILELPLDGRQATDLIQLAGAAVPQGVAGPGGFPNTGQTVIAGGQAIGAGFYLDGGLFNNPWDNANLPFPFPDALQEFKVETSALDASKGVHAAASINAATKAGTNEFHGDIFEFLRNNALNAQNFFTNASPNEAKDTLAQPVWRRAWRPANQKQAVLFWRVPRHPDAHGCHRGRFCADHGHAGRRFFGLSQRNPGGFGFLFYLWQAGARLQLRSGFVETGAHVADHIGFMWPDACRVPHAHR
jgi:hypothetical protein